jgi:hypothetical protein
MLVDRARGEVPSHYNNGCGMVDFICTCLAGQPGLESIELAGRDEKRINTWPMFLDSTMCEYVRDTGCAYSFNGIAYHAAAVSVLRSAAC